MSISVKQLREMIAGLSDEALVGLATHLRDSVDELTYVELKGVYVGDDGIPHIAVEVSMLDEDDDDFDDEDDDSEPVGSCDRCGVNLYKDDDEDLCNQCSWEIGQ